MNDVNYVLLDPTGNLTCLVLDRVPEEERPRVTARLMACCEQVGYLTAPADPRARAGLRMMGGEFCGNASMATAVYLASRAGQREARMLLEVSGAESLVECEAKRTPEGWQGRVEMPLPRGMESIRLEGRDLTAVHFPGMTHLILAESGMPRPDAEALMRAAAAELDAPAIGLLQWEEKAGGMTPLVFVRESSTLVWETACGSGSCAIACWKAARAGHSVRVRVAQPGGTLLAEADWQQTWRKVWLTGHVRINMGALSGKPSGAGLWR